ncbi:MAG: NADH:ubiquinone reductase (Na(+)-transporting) subunit B [Rhodobacteraceae bacterium]|nr:NADH:ubiquinone reductase (Na(+)-transporting) subunit B [Paracoccaceae bacterium]
MGVRDFFDRIEPDFEKGGKYEKYFPLYEMVESFIYSPKTVTTAAPHARSYVDMKRIMIYVVLATIPAIFIGLWNVGYQANAALMTSGIEPSGWRAAILSALGIGFNPGNHFANFMHGLMYFLPIYVVTLVAGGICEVIFSIVRGHEVNEGFLVTSMLYALILPATVPLWQVALGIIFGVIIGKEVFGGTGKNFLNPALTARAFLYFAYPAQLSGDSVWIAVDGYTGATSLAVAAADGMSEMMATTGSWWMHFWGFIPGSMGEVSTAAILLGGLFLIATKIVNWRIVAGVMVGTIAFSGLLNFVGSDSNPMFAMPWYWHLVVGGFAFGMIFMATEPVSASHTNTGRWIYGILIGFMVVMIRVINPAFPEGMMLAILFGNVFAPLIDYFVVQANIRRRARRHAV